MDTTKLIIALVVILLTVLPGGMGNVFPGHGNGAEEITETEEPALNERGVFQLEEEPSSAAPAPENRSTEGGENETSMMTDF